MLIKDANERVSVFVFARGCAGNFYHIATFISFIWEIAMKTSAMEMKSFGPEDLASRSQGQAEKQEGCVFPLLLLGTLCWWQDLLF